jgi:hypothetical protein
MPKLLIRDVANSWSTDQLGEVRSRQTDPRVKG